LSHGGRGGGRGQKVGGGGRTEREEGVKGGRGRISGIRKAGGKGGGQPR